MPQNDGTLLIDDAHIIFPNFQGKEGRYNREGDRNFCILISDELAAQLEDDGWTVKYLKAREEGDEPRPYLQVNVKYGKGKPPRIVMLTSRGRTPIDEETVDMLDYVDVRKADVILNPYHYNVNGRTGINGYLRTMFITIEEDELERRYAEIEDAPRP